MIRSTFEHHVIDSEADYLDIGSRRRFLSSPISSDCRVEKCTQYEDDDVDDDAFLPRIFAKKKGIYLSLYGNCLLTAFELSTVIS